MWQKKAVSLVELIVALCVFAVLILSISSVANSLSAIKRDMFDKQAPIIQGNLAIATISERILRASSLNASGSQVLNITDGGRRVDFRRFGVNESIYQDAQQIKYISGSAERTILSGVNSLAFGRDLKVPAPTSPGEDPYNNRLNIEIKLTSGENFRTCVQPRNEYTPPSIIN